MPPTGTIALGTGISSFTVRRSIPLAAQYLSTATLSNLAGVGGCFPDSSTHRDIPDISVACTHANIHFMRMRHRSSAVKLFCSTSHVCYRDFLVCCLRSNRIPSPLVHSQVLKSAQSRESTRLDGRDAVSVQPPVPMTKKRRTLLSARKKNEEFAAAWQSRT